MPRNRVAALIAAAAAVLAVGACTAGPTTTTPNPPAPGSAAPAAPQPALAAKEVGDLGTVLVDQEGYTLYRYDGDKADPATTTCVDACATKWPPFVVDRAAKLRVDGVEDADIGLLERPDGKTQLTVKGWAVYRYSGDRAPGATDGQGAGGTWYAVTPAGKKASPV